VRAVTANVAAVLHAPGDVRIEQRPIPEPGPREVLVEVRAVGVCGSDVHYFEHGRIGDHVVRAPLVLGHESSGVVAGVGSGVRRHSVGDRVALEPGVPCGACRECRAGRYNLCPEVRFFATPPVDGAFANYVTIHEDFAFPLPAGLTDEEGALMEPLSVAIWACRKGQVGPDTGVLVTGAGPIGQLAVQVAAALGATELTVTDVNPHRLRVASERGASRTVDVSRTPLAEAGVEADVLLECSGHPDAVREGVRALRPAGRAVMVGMGPTDEMAIPMAVVQNRELWLTGTFRYANTYPAAIALAAAGRVNLRAIITGRFALEDTEAALRAGREDPASIKPLVVPGALVSAGV
jgi:L-iditol 2-dehydrogenase